MTYPFPNDIQELVQQQLASGRFDSEDEVLREALQRLVGSESERKEICSAADNGKNKESIESAYDILKRHGLIGAVRSGHPDLSTNSVHMEGFGRSGNIRNPG